MKLRIQASGITLRLHPEELPLIMEKKQLSQTTKLPGGSFSLLLEVADTDTIGMQYDQSSFTFYIPENQLKAWIHSDRVGFTRHYEGLTLTIEKDMPRRSKAL